METPGAHVLFDTVARLRQAVEGDRVPLLHGVVLYYYGYVFTEGIPAYRSSRAVQTENGLDIRHPLGTVAGWFRGRRRRSRLRPRAVVDERARAGLLRWHRRTVARRTLRDLPIVGRRHHVAIAHRRAASE